MERRPLSAGINALSHADPDAVRQFIAPEPQKLSTLAHTESQSTVTMDRLRGQESRPERRQKPTGVSPVGMIPMTVRIRPEIAGALKRASLERQLAGQTPFTQQDLVEAALEPWLRAQGHLK